MSEQELDENGVPYIDAYEANETQWAVWCEHCCWWHLHGAGPGDRVAHCFEPGSPYHRDGYNLRYVGKLTPEVRAAHRDEMRSGQRRRARRAS